MKIRNIFGFALAAAFAFGSCTPEQDMTKVDEWLGEKFNQQVLWDVDSMAFRRASWVSEDVASGLQIRKSQVKMWESVQSISYVTYSPNMFNTYLGYTGTEGTVSDIAANYEGALFAINAGSLTAGKPTDYFKLDNTVVTADNSTNYATGLIGLTSSAIGVSADVSLDLDASDYTSAMTATLLVYNAKARTFPDE